MDFALWKLEMNIENVAESVTKSHGFTFGDSHDGSAIKWIKKL